MKKLLILIALIVVSFGVNAQDFAGRLGTANKVFNGATTDTLLVTIPKSRSAITFHNQVTKDSLTVAGTIVIQAKLTSLSGEVWHTLDSHTITDGTQSDWVTFTSNQGLYYRVIRTTATGAGKLNSFLLYRQ